MMNYKYTPPAAGRGCIYHLILFNSLKVLRSKGPTGIAKGQTLAQIPQFLHFSASIMYVFFPSEMQLEGQFNAQIAHFIQPFSGI